MLDINALPNDVDNLKRLLIERETAHQAQLREKQHEIQHLKFQLAQLRRARFGQSSEQLEGARQLPLTLEELKAAVPKPRARHKLSRQRLRHWRRVSPCAAGSCPGTSSVSRR